MSGAAFTSFTATFGAPTTAGHAIIVGITFGNLDPTITLTDTQGDTFSQAIKSYDSWHRQGSAIFYATNLKGGAPTTVTVRFSSSVAYLGLGIHEYSGIAFASALDGTSGATGTGTSLSSGSAVTSVGGDLVFGTGVEDSVGGGDTFAAGSNFVKRTDLGSAAAYADEDAVQSTAGAIAATWLLSPSGRNWVANVAAFKTASGGGTTGPSITNLSPASGPIGTSVTITGSNFGATQGTSTVKFNGTAATTTSWSATSIVAPVPTGATTGNVLVTVGGVASNGVLFTVPTVPATAALVQAVSAPSTQGNTSISSYTLNLPNPSLAGNGLILAFQYGTDSSLSTSVTDNKSDTWVLGASGSDNNQTVKIYYLLNAPAGVHSVTISFSPADTASWVQASAVEFKNIAPSNAADGSSCNSDVSNSVAAGNMTTTASGDLIFQYAEQDTTGFVSSWTQGASPWALLYADRGVPPSNTSSQVAQYQVQATAGAINPVLAMSPSAQFESCAIALKSADAGTAPTGMRVVHLQHEALPQSVASPIELQFPTTGNLIVAAAVMEPGKDLTGITDSEGNTYLSTGSAFGYNASGDNQIYYVPNAATNTALTVTVSKIGTDVVGSTILFMDIAGASASPYDTGPGAGRQTNSGIQLGGNVAGVTITPSTANGLVITSIGVENNSIAGVSPGNFLPVIPAPLGLDSAIDENNGWTVFYNSATSPITFTWTTSAAVNDWASVAVAFKVASAP